MRGLAALLGHPVAHSVSPAIHDAAFAARGVDAVYVAFDVACAALAEAVAGLRALGFLGANVTVPHKQDVWDLCDRHTDEARAVGAVNTLYWDDEDLVGDNTDAGGLGEVLDELDLAAGEPCALLGSGGAARAAAVALGRRGLHVTVAARRAGPAAAVAALARDAGAAGGEVGDWDGAGSIPRLVVNATPLGLHGEALPPAWTRLGPGQVALDLIYRETPFLASARDGGAAAVGGLGMLVGQAARSFERWTGMDAPRAVMRAAAEAALK